MQDPNGDDSYENLFEQSLSEYEKLIGSNKKESNRSELYKTSLESERKSSARRKLLKESSNNTSPDKDNLHQDEILAPYEYVVEIYEDNSKYEGQKSNGMRNGKGTYEFSGGFKYIGNWRDDEMSGFGTMYVNAEILYEGEWKNNLFHGRGLLHNLERPDIVNETIRSNLDDIHLTWHRYEGEFYKGLRHGYGTLFYSNGDFFFGNFRKGNIHGKGSYTKPGSYKIAAVWEENNLVEELIRGEDNSTSSFHTERSRVLSNV